MYDAPEYAKPKAHLTLTSNLLDLDEISPPAPKDAPPAPFEPFPGIIAVGEGRGKRVRVGGLEFTDARLRLELKDQIFRMADIRAKSYGGMVSGSVVHDRSNLTQPDVRIDARIDTVEAGEFLSAFIPVKGLLSGRFSTTFDAIAPLDKTGSPIVSALSLLGAFKLEGGRVEKWLPLNRLSSFLNVPEVAEVSFRTLAGSLQIDKRR